MRPWFLCLPMIFAMGCQHTVDVSPVCDSDFHIVGNRCVDDDECQKGTHNCHAFATCTNEPAGSFTCECNDGYDGTGTDCTDIDECELGTDDCTESQVCQNLEGNGWRCFVANEVSMSTTSNSPTWSPSTIVNTGEPLVWAVSGGVTIDEETIDTPSFDLSGNTDTAIITVRGSDGLAGLEEISAAARDIVAVDIRAATQLEKVDFFANPLPSLDVSQNTQLEDIWVQQGSLTHLDISTNIHARFVAVEENNLTTFDVSQNTLLTRLWIHENQLDSATLDHLVITLDAHGLSDGELYIADNVKNNMQQELTATAHEAYANLIGKNWDIDVGPPPDLCPTGHSHDGSQCVDDDECAGEGAGNNCSVHATCENTVGGFTCTCNSDLTGDGVHCVSASVHYFVSPGGHDSNPGTEESPFATLEAADAAAEPGALITIRGGTYAQPVRLTTSGTQGAPIRYEAYPGETAVFQGPGRGQTPAVEQIRISGNWIVLRGVWVQDSVQAGVRVFGDHVHLDNLTIRRGGTTGINFFQADNGTVTNSLISESYNQFNADGEPADGGGADGISFAHCNDGLISHCITWGNSDDGYDMWGSMNSRIEYSYAFGNGINRWGTDGFNGDGNGFKMGNCESRGNTSYRNVSFANDMRGFDNNCADDGSITHCTSYDDKYGFRNSRAGNVFNNNVAIASRNALVQENADSARSNSWDLEIDVIDLDLISITAPVLTGDESAAEALALFEASDFLRPTSGGPLVDVGEDTGESFEGGAPDLGAYEVQ